MPRLFGRRWSKARARHLGEHPYCVYCEAEGRRFTMATVVDHIEPHRGDPVKFWDPGNWQSLCKTHHDAAKQAEEKGAPPRGCDIDGVPLDRAHHWHQ